MVYRRDYRRNKTAARIGQRFSITNTLIIINVVLFFLFFIFSIFISDLIRFVAVKPYEILSGNYIWTIFTSIFMHASFFHLFVNMLSLFFLGSLTEQIVGRKRFIWFYLIAGIVGSLFFVFFAYFGEFIFGGEFLFGNIDDFAVGASGAIFGILGLLATLIPRKRVYLIVGPIIVIVLQILVPLIYSPISSYVDFIGSILIFMMIFSMFSRNMLLRKMALPLSLPFWLAPIIAIVPLIIISYFIGVTSGENLPIGNTAHLGGLVVGLIYGAYLRNKYRQKVKMLNKMIR